MMLAELVNISYQFGANMIEPGQTIELHYPISNTVESPSDYRLRRVRVLRVRDLVTQPLTLQEFLRRPYVRRSRWLLTGYDLNAGKFRQFYLGSSDEHRAPGVLRVALYQPGKLMPVDTLPIDFEDTLTDRKLLLDVVAELLNRDLHDLRVGIYANDLRVMRSLPDRSERLIERSA